MEPAMPGWLEISNGVVSRQHSNTEVPFLPAIALTFRYSVAEAGTICSRRARPRPRKWDIFMVLKKSVIEVAHAVDTKPYDENLPE
jgi:hypothetical protein